MRYCKKCGAEIPEGAGFCEKCGNPVGGMQKQGNGKKKWILAISSGVIILAVATVGALFAMGVIGGKDDVVQTDADATVPQGVSSVTGEAVSNTEELEGNKQKDALENNNSEDMAWEAFQAYKDLINAERNEWDEEGMGVSYDSSHYFALIYLDSDAYPELLVCQIAVRPSDGIIYTYKGGGAEEITYFAGGYISYQENEGYIYSRGWYTCDWTECMALYNGDSARSLFNNTISDSNYENNYYGVEKVAQLVGIDNRREWITLDFADSTDGSDIAWGENIDEAYTQLLRKNKKN